MSLLRRRSSHKELALENLRLTRGSSGGPNAGTIYGTRHPDWSSHPKRGPEEQGRSLSPIPFRPESPGLPVPIDTEKKMKNIHLNLDPDTGAAVGIDALLSRSISPVQTRHSIPRIDKPLPSAPAAPAETTQPAGPELSKAPITPIFVLEPPNTPTTIVPEVRPLSPDGGDTPTGERRRGVTLVDNPLALPHHSLVNSSRFSFEGSSKSPSAAASAVPSAATSQAGGDDSNEEQDDDDLSSFRDGSFHFDLGEGGDDDEDDGFERANEGLFTNKNIMIEDPEAQFDALQAAVEEMKQSMIQAQQGIGEAMSQLQVMTPSLSILPFANAL